jgi:hypothetical protein
MTKVPPPRAVFIDHPVGRTFGRPGERSRHQEVLATALTKLPNFTEPEQMLQLDCQWDTVGSRSWEDELRNLLLSDR